jgi:hypothetical protein
VHAVEFSKIGRTRVLASQPSPQGNFSILHIPTRLSNRLSGARDPTTADSTRKWKKPILDRNRTDSPGADSDGVVRCLRGARPSGLPLYPLGRTTITLRRTGARVESSPHPGRVVAPIRVNTRKRRPPAALALIA